MKILFVCLGNICRSPMAEGIMQKKIDAHNLDWQVDSAGTGIWHIGEPPDDRSIDKASEYDIDITGLRGRQFQQSDFDRFDLIFVMDQSNHKNVLRFARNARDRSNVRMIMSMVEAGNNLNVPDPYWDDDGFEQVYHMLDEACGNIVDKYADQPLEGITS